MEIKILRRVRDVGSSPLDGISVSAPDSLVDFHTGLFGFLSESKVPGSVPALGSIVLPYDGDYMAPLEPLHFLN